MATHPLYRDFLTFLDRLAAGRDDPWALYEACYLEPHRPVLSAWWEQCLGLPLETWQARVRSIRPSDYGLLRTLVEQAPPEAIAARALEACGAAVGRLRPQPPSPSALPPLPPDIYLLVGFFSPDAFVFRVREEWAIGLGLERFGDWSRLPVLVAHEYAHCLRRRHLPAPATLKQRLVDEGLAAHFSRLAFPEQPLPDHLLMTRGEYNSLLAYGPRLLAAVEPHLDSTDPETLRRFLFGRMKGQPARAGCLLGYRMVEETMAERGTTIEDALGTELG